MRFKNAVRNSVVAFVGQLLNVFLGFGVRTLFIRYLSKEFLGVNGVMESMITLLSVTELGLGTSIAFALYAPVNSGDEKHICSLMNFYKKTYRVIGIATIVLGAVLVPFMRFFAKEATSVPHLNLIYIIFLANTALSYFFSYKRTLLNAYQENYITSLCEDIFAVVKYIVQAVVLVVLNSYIGYLVTNLVFNFASNALISAVCSKRHPVASEYKDEKLSSEDKALLKKSVVSLMFQKVGGSLVNGTDNLMISYVGIALMGVYSNYSMIISIIERVVNNVMRSLVGSVGNLMVQRDADHKYKVYEEFAFTTFCLFFFISAVLAGCMERFIALWAGSDWVLSPNVTFVVIMNFFLQGTRHPNIAIIDTAGLFNKIRPKAVFEVLVNLVVSFLFLVVFDMGIYGVLFGTTVSKLGVCIWWEAWAVHKYSFEMSLSVYAVKYLKSAAVTAAGCFASYYIAGALPVGGFAGLVLAGLVSAFVCIALVLIVYGRSHEFRGMTARLVKR
ncbi:MAG: hypothetical protein IJ365_08790 [Clostridia bacterium]|nr:hypothetical protein [Clostridia bacterium]